MDLISDPLSNQAEWDFFCEDYAEIAQENRLRVSFTLDLIKEFRGLGIDLIPLKGIDLLMRAYPSHGMRPMADIDLLIRAKDISRVRKLFEDRGFTRKPDEGLTYISADRKINLDILWDIWYLPDKKSCDEMWRRAVSETYEGHALQFLHPEDAFLYLVAYVTAHRGVFSQIFVQDLQIFLSRYGNDICWEKLQIRIKHLKLCAPAYHGLTYACTTGLEGIPDDWPAVLKPRTFWGKLETFFYTHCVSEKPQPKVSYLLTWLSYPGIRSKFKLLREKFFPSRFEFELHQGGHSLHQYLIFLVIHPFLIIARSLLQFLRVK